jgi:amiloride-sensitive sodium channel
MKVIDYLANNSSIHGVKFLVDSKVNKVLRLFWCVVFVGSIFGLSLYVEQLYVKLSVEPEISIRINLKPMSDIPFPAVTICGSLFARDNLLSFREVFRSIKNGSETNLTGAQKNYFAANIQVCAPHLTIFSDALDNRTEFDTVKLLDESSYTTNEVFISCSYRRWLTNVSDGIFNRVLTDRGFCHSANMQGYYTIFNKGVLSKDFDNYRRRNIVRTWIRYSKASVVDDDNETVLWSLDDGYKVKGEDFGIIPKRASKENFLYVYAFVNNSDRHNICPDYGATFRIFFHLPNEIPTFLHDEQSFQFGHKKTMFLTAKSYRGDDSLKRFAPDKRRCYFQGERQLKFFKSYTKHHCDLECVTNYTLSVCGCVKFSMPRDQSTKVCDVDKMRCYYNATLMWPNNSTHYDDSKTACDCYPTCNDIKYAISYEDVAEFNFSSLIDTKKWVICQIRCNFD